MSTIPTYKAKVEVLRYYATKTAEAGTDSTTINITSNGLSTDDFIVNTTRRAETQMLAERGSRKVQFAALNYVTISSSYPVAGQTAGDEFRLYRYEDVTDVMLDGTLNISDRAGGGSECSFNTRQAIFNVGQYVRIRTYKGVEDNLRFAGIITGYTHSKAADSTEEHIYQINCAGFNNIPSRRTINIDYEADYISGDIVKHLISTYLYQEGIEEGEISNGIAIQEAWKGDVISISDVLDEIASRNGFQWFISKLMKLNFYKDASTVSSCAYQIKNDGAFSDFRNVNIIKSIDNYINKNYVIGGNDDHGDVIWTMNGSLEEQNRMQGLCGGTGVYGSIHRDSAIVNHDYLIAEAGTTQTVLNITSHPFTVGDFFWNVSRNGRGYVTTVSNVNSVETTNIPNQQSGDTIEVYYDANLVGKEIIRKQAQIPEIIEFSSYHLEFYPQTKLTVQLSDMSTLGVFNIDEVNISDKGSGYFEARVKAVLRDDSNFSTQKNPDYKDFFRGF